MNLRWKFVLILLTVLVGLVGINSSALPLDPMPGAPVTPIIVPPNGTIFDLAAAPGGVQDGTRITPFGTNPGADIPFIGGPCGSFVTGEICGTLEPGAGLGVRDWEVELANDTGGPATPSFIAAFRAPGLAQAWVIPALLPGQGVFIDLRYLGPTLPLFGDFSFLPFPIDLETTIVDPPITLTPLLPEVFSAPGVGLPTLPVENDSLISDAQFGVSSGVPEPNTLALIGAGLLGVALFRFCLRRQR